MHPLVAFRRGLYETGYVEGQNVAIEFRSAESQVDRFPALAADLVRRLAAVIFAASTSAVRGAVAASATIPIVFNMGEDPVKEGLVATPDRKNEDEPQSLRSMQIRWCNGFQFATIFRGRPKLSVILAIHASSALRVAPVTPWLPGTARPDSTESSGAF